MRNRSWKKATPQDSETTSPQQSQWGQGLSKGCFSPKAEARRRPKFVEAKNCRPSSTKLIDGYLFYLDSWMCSWTLSLAFGQGSLGRFSLYKVLNASLWLWRTTKDNYPNSRWLHPPGLCEFSASPQAAGEHYGELQLTSLFNLAFLQIWLVIQ